MDGRRDWQKDGRRDDTLRDSLGSRVRRRARERLSRGEPDLLPRLSSTALRSGRTEPGPARQGREREPEHGTGHRHGTGHEHGTGRGLCLPDGWLFGLLLPADPGRSCALLMLRDQASSLSEALGGVLLDETAVDGRPTHRCWLYLDVTRYSRRLPRNQRLHRLATDLGWPRSRSGDWLGPALITGRDLRWADRDVPSIVVAAALHETTP
jgi:hypothetical protein